MPSMYFELPSGRVLHDGDTITEEKNITVPERDKAFFSPSEPGGED